MSEPRPTPGRPAASDASGDTAPERAALTPAAQRALAEAEERRLRARQSDTAVEVGGRKGPDPVRFGDWEKGGIASDF